MANFTWGGRSWGSDDLNAFKKWLASRGSSYSTWSRRHPGAARTFRPSSRAGGRGAATQSFLDIARTRANEAVAPELELLTGEREASRKRFQDLSGYQAGLGQALAQSLGTIAPGVQQTYEDAANAQAAYGKGFADTQLAASEAEKATLAPILERSGAPQEQIDQVNAKAGGPDAADVVYGTGGFIPAAQLGEEGAAMTSLAQMLPAQAAGRTQDWMRESMGAMLEKDLDLLNKIQGVKAKIPGLTSESVKEQEEAKRAQEAIDIQREYLGLSSRKTDAELTGVDPTTGLPTVEAQAGAAKAAGKKKDARSKAVKAREDAFQSARLSIFDEASKLVKPVSDPFDWVFKHPGSKVSDAPQFEALVPYEQARATLYNKYKSLLRYASGPGKAALQNRIYQIIDEALAAAGIEPEPQASAEGPQPGLSGDNPRER